MLKAVFCSNLKLFLVEFRQPGWVGCVLAFLTLCKVGFVSGFVCLAMCIVLKKVDTFLFDNPTASLQFI